jgi:ectoine hydroxylase-related dioxygenase (phytanoyl-CoA dioxygenase family)
MFGGTNEELPSVLALANSPKLMAFFDRFLGGESMTYDYKWVRAMGPGKASHCHYDIVYMGRGTKDVYTVWTPIGDVPKEMGSLALCLGSQHFDKVREVYGSLDVDRDRVDGPLTDDPVEIVDKLGGIWATTDFQAGDILIFGMFLLHFALKNSTNRYRTSMDTRYQLRSEPVDERWVGAKPIGHYSRKDAAPIASSQSVREKIGLEP